MTRNALMGAALLAVLAWPAVAGESEPMPAEAGPAAAEGPTAAECARQCCIAACMAGAQDAAEEEAAAVEEPAPVEEEMAPVEDPWAGHDDTPEAPRAPYLSLRSPAKACTFVRWGDRTKCNRNPFQVTHHFTVVNLCDHDVRAYWVDARDTGRYPVTAPPYERVQILTVGESAEDHLSCIHARFQPRIVMCSEYDDHALRALDAACGSSGG